MSTNVRSTFLYDVTREMRGLALAEKLEACFPESAAAMSEALRGGGRIVFSPDDGEYYQEFEMDQFFHDPRTGRTCGVRKL